MQKPLIVCGMDFSGTSMVAGMLHAAGIDMGDVESAEDVAQSDRPIRYRLFEDRQLQELVQPCVARIMAHPTRVRGEVGDIFYTFCRYLDRREEEACGKRWGVKSNVLTFLALHPRWQELPVQWITTYRPLEESVTSAFRKLGNDPQLAAFLGVQYMAYGMLEPFTHCIEYADAEDGNFARIHRVLSGLFDVGFPIDALYSVIDKRKGVIPWQPHGSPLPV